MKYLVALIVVLIATGGAYLYFRDDPLGAALNKRWPPIDAQQQRQKAVDSTAAALTLLSHPNVAAGTDIKTIEEVASKQLSGNGVTKLAVSADHQLLRLVADFDRTFSADDLPADFPQRDLVNRLKPHVIGQIEVLFGASTALVAQPQRTIELKLLPVLRDIHIDKVTLDNRADVTAAADVVTSVINKYADNIVSGVSQTPLLNVKLPASFQETFDPASAIKLTIPGAPNIKVSLSAAPRKYSFELTAVAWLIDDGAFSMMTQIVPAGQAPSSPPPTQPSNFDAIKAAFQRQLEEGLGMSGVLPATWVGIGKALIATSLDNVLAQASPRFVAQGPVPREAFSQKVHIPDETVMDCTPTTDCTPTDACDLQVDTRDCRKPRSCDHGHDTRNCSACILRAPWDGHCIQSGNDPFCEAAKAAQNQIYDRAFDACNALGPIDDLVCEGAKAGQNTIYAQSKLQCEAGKSAKKAACEAGKATVKLACEGAKEGLKRLSRTGNLANIDGSITGDASLNLGLRDVHFGDGMDTLSLNIQISGDAGLDTHFKFVPLDIIGHLACPLEWTADKRISTRIPSQTIPLKVTLARRVDGDNQYYDGLLDAFDIKLYFEPSPLSLILQNINFYLACAPAAGLINGVTLNLAPFIPELLKDYTYKQSAISFTFTPDVPVQKVMGQDVKPVLSETPLAILVTGHI